MRHLAFAAVLAAAAPGALAQEPAPVAFVADLAGPATLSGDGRLEFLAPLPPQTRILVGSGGHATVTFVASGAEYTLKGPGEFVVAQEAVRAERGAAPAERRVAALRNAALLQQAAGTARASLRMRGLGGLSPAPLLYPVDTRVATLRPELRWRVPIAGAPALVRLLDAAGEELWRGEATGPVARPGVRLAPGASYAWTVGPPGGPEARARFETLPAEALIRLERARAASRRFPERVVHALLLEELGATQDAREAWAALARERPDLPQLAGRAR